MGIVSSIIHHFSEFINIDKEVTRNASPVHPSIKIVLHISLLVFVMQFFSLNALLFVFLLLILVTIAIKGFSRLFFDPMVFLLVFSAITSGFFILLNWSGFIASLQTFQVNYLYDPGIFNFLLVFNLKIIISLWGSRILLFTTPISDFVYGLRKLRIPTVFVNLFAITFRYIFLLSEELVGVTIAKELRASNIKSMKKKYKALGNVYAAILSRSLKRSENVYLAMSMRGKIGNFISRSPQFSTTKSLLFTTGMVSLFFVSMLFL